MSRGPGIWQRVILGIVESMNEQQYVLAAEVVPMAANREATATEMVAIRRAIKALALAGKLSAGTFRTHNARGSESMLLGFAPKGTLVRSTLHAAMPPEWHDMSR